MASDRKKDSRRARLMARYRRHKVSIALIMGLVTFLLFLGGQRVKLSQKKYQITLSDVTIVPMEVTQPAEAESIASENEFYSQELVLDDFQEEPEEVELSLFEEPPPSLTKELEFIPLPAQINPRNRHTVVNYRTTKCTYYCQLVLSLGYETRKSMTMYPKSNPPELLLINYKKYSFYSGMKHTVINVVGRGSSCIGGGKGRQLWCHEELAADAGCDFDDLHIQPKQVNIQQPAKCQQFFAVEEAKNSSKIYIAKPGGSYHGKGITIHDDLAKMKKHFGGCHRVLGDGVIIQDYIERPLLFEGHKFDFRSYLLIASTEPFIVFYADGFVRKASGKYSTDSASLKDPLKQVTNDVGQSEEDHFFSFKQLEERTSFVRKEFVPHAMRVSNYLFHTAKMGYNHKGLVPTPGRYQLFALDWMIDEGGKFHLLEGNGNPLITHYEGIDLTPGLWTSMLELERLIHVQPEDFSESLSVEEGFKYKHWNLVYNELEVEAKGEEYMPCKFEKYGDINHPLYSYSQFV